MKAVAILLFSIALGACSLKSVRCDGSLTPINPPQKVDTTPGTAAPIEHHP